MAWASGGFWGFLPAGFLPGLIAGCLALGMIWPGYATTPALEACQALAGDPNAPGSRGAGVASPGAISSIEAVQACQQAVDAAPSHPAAYYNLGRAVLAAGALQNLATGIGAFRNAAAYAQAEAAKSELGEAAPWYAAAARAYLTPETHRRAAEQGDPLAQVLMASLDQAAAAHWIAQALRSDDAYAHYMAGHAARPRWREAARHFEIAAGRGHSWSQLELFQYYRDGYGVPKDKGKSEEWLRKAAASGNSRAIAVYARREQPAPAQPQVPGAAPVIPVDLAREVEDAIAGITRGEFDTHFYLPLQQPLLFALTFEFADELQRRCPRLVPDGFREQREALWMAYVHYSAWRRDPALPQLNFKGMSLAEATARLISMRLGEANYPAFFRRKLILPDVPVLVDAMISRGGGCAGKALPDVAGNLVAIGSFGKLPRYSFEATLIGRKPTDNQLGFLCRYKTDDRTVVQVQGYRTPNFAAMLRESPWGAFWEAINRDIDEKKYGKGSLPKPDIPFIRSDCPLTVDPRYRASTEYVLPPAPVFSGTMQERMAAYFIEYHIPNFGMRETKAPLKLGADDLSRLKQEIIRFESIPVSMLEVDAAIRESELKDIGRGSPRPREPQEIRRRRFESSLRMKKYRAAHGDALFDLTRAQDGVPNYIVARDNETMLDIRGVR